MSSPLERSKKLWGFYNIVPFILELSIALASLTLTFICVTELAMTLENGTIDGDWGLSVGAFTAFLIVMPLFTLLVSSVNLALHRSGRLRPFYTLVVSGVMLIGWLVQIFFWVVSRREPPKPPPRYEGIIRITELSFASLIFILYWAFSYVSVAALAVSRAYKRAKENKKPTKTRIAD